MSLESGRGEKTKNKIDKNVFKDSPIGDLVRYSTCTYSTLMSSDAFSLQSALNEVKFKIQEMSGIKNNDSIALTLLQTENWK